MLTGNLQIKNGKYYAVLNLKVNGKRKPKWIPLGLPERGNKREAESMLSHLIVEYESRGEGKFYPTFSENGELVTEAPKVDESEVLFADYVQSWLKMIRPTVSAATYNSYRSMVDARIDRNPADRVDKPRKNRYQAAHYSQEEMLRLFGVIEGDPLEPAIRIAAYYGLRRSEVLGLKWDAINFKDKTISIRHKVVELTEGGKSVLHGEDVLKTKSSVRTLPLLPVIEDLLRQEKQRQETYRGLFRGAYCKDFLDYVCVDQMGKLLRPNYVTEHFAWIIQKYGLRKIRFHDLRHTAASLLLANGVPMKQIQIWLGHSTFSTTADIYAHLDVSAQRETGLVAANLYDKRHSEA